MNEAQHKVVMKVFGKMASIAIACRKSKAPTLEKWLKSAKELEELSRVLRESIEIAIAAGGVLAHVEAKKGKAA